jgi:hypothetical protein
LDHAKGRQHGNLIFDEGFNNHRQNASQVTTWSEVVILIHGITPLNPTVGVSQPAVFLLIVEENAVSLRLYL